nr:MAG TPA: hypothetical protein [Caudoviricetes sp.]
MRLCNLGVDTVIQVHYNGNADLLHVLSLDSHIDVGFTVGYLIHVSVSLVDNLDWFKVSANRHEDEFGVVDQRIAGTWLINLRDLYQADTVDIANETGGVALLFHVVRNPVNIQNLEQLAQSGTGAHDNTLGTSLIGNQSSQSFHILSSQSTSFLELCWNGGISIHKGRVDHAVHEVVPGSINLLNKSSPVDLAGHHQLKVGVNLYAVPVGLDGKGFTSAQLLTKQIVMVAGEFGDGQQGVILNIEVVDITQSNVSLLYIFSEKRITAPTGYTQIFNGILDDIKDQLFIVADCSAQLLLGVVLRQLQNLRKTLADCGVGVRKAKVICIDTVCSVDHQFSEICVHCLTLSFTLFASWRAVESIANDLDQHTLISPRTVTIGFNLADSCLKSSLGSVSGLFLIFASGCGICNNVVANNNFGRYSFDQGSGYLVTVSWLQSVHSHNVASLVVEIGFRSLSFSSGSWQQRNRTNYEYNIASGSLFALIGFSINALTYNVTLRPDSTVVAICGMYKV